MTYLLSVLKSREKSSVSAAFLAIGLIAQAIGPNIRRHLPKISEAVRMSLPVKDAASKSVCFELSPLSMHCTSNSTANYTAPLHGWSH